MYSVFKGGSKGSHFSVNYSSSTDYCYPSTQNGSIYCSDQCTVSKNSIKAEEE